MLTIADAVSGSSDLVTLVVAVMVPLNTIIGVVVAYFARRARAESVNTAATVAETVKTTDRKIEQLTATNKETVTTANDAVTQAQIHAAAAQKALQMLLETTNGNKNK